MTDDIKCKPCFKYATDEPEHGFVGRLLHGGIFQALRFALAVYLLAFVVLNIDAFLVYREQETKYALEANLKYAHICEQQTVEETSLFHTDCVNYAIGRSKSPTWEAFVRLARRQKLCGEDDCGSVVYIMLGIVIGCIGLICLLPKVQQLCKTKIDQMNDDTMTSFATSSRGGDSWGFGSDNWGLGNEKKRE